jgi:hypothetical protein
MIPTAKVKNRRKLRFGSFDDVLRDAERLAEAQRAGSLRVLGNWSLGQAIGHLAYWARMPHEGYPPLPPRPWLWRIVAPLLKPIFLNKGLPAGARIQGVPEGTFGTQPMATDQALAEYRPALTRLQAEAPTLENPFFGRMSHDQWIKLNLRHAELHLGFFQPDR